MSRRARRVMHRLVGGPWCGRDLALPERPTWVWVYEDGSWGWTAAGRMRSARAGARAVGSYRARVSANSPTLWWTEEPRTEGRDARPGGQECSPRGRRELSPFETMTLDAVFRLAPEQLADDEAAEVVRRVFDVVCRHPWLRLDWEQLQAVELLAKHFAWSPIVRDAVKALDDALSVGDWGDEGG